MTVDEVLKRAYAMPLTNPAFPPGPYRFYNREFFVVTYRTDIDALRAVVPEPLEIVAPIVKYEFGTVLCATMTMGYKHRIAPVGPVEAALAQPNFLIKIIPHVDASPRICELVRYHMRDVVVKGAWTSPAALDLHPHALADVDRLPVREIVSGAHFIADLTLDLGEVVFDYLAKGKP